MAIVIQRHCYVVYLLVLVSACTSLVQAHSSPQDSGHNDSLPEWSILSCSYEQVKDLRERRMCPTLFQPTEDGGCMCSNTNGFIGSTTKCNQATNESKLLIGYCMSYNNSTGETFLGPCPYSALHGLPVRETFVPLPCDPSEANEYICSQFNRTGLLCSHCMEGLGPAVFSYELKCVPCLDSRYGWLVYLLAAILPMTLFFSLSSFFKYKPRQLQ